MTNEEIKDSIEAYKAQLVLINRTMQKIKENCKHHDTEVKTNSESVTTLKNFCKYCDTELGYPTKDELKNAGYSIT